MTALYGPILGADDVRNAVIEHLRTWAPAYVAEVARQTTTAAEHFRDFDIRDDQDLDNGDQMPACLVLCPTIQPAGVHGDRVHATASVDVWIYAQGRTVPESVQSVGRLAKAVRAAVMQHRQLDGFARDTRWLGEGLERPVADRERQRAFTSGAVVLFEVDLATVTDRSLGPDTPPDDPSTVPDDPETIATTNVQIDALE